MSTNKQQSRRSGLFWWLICIIGFLIIIGMIWFSTWGHEQVGSAMFPGKSIANIEDYDSVRRVIQSGYPYEGRFLPQSIPVNAYDEYIEASSISAFQATPRIYLEFYLHPSDAQEELDRLQSLRPTDIIRQGVMTRDPLERHQPSEGAVVMGFLDPFVPDYRNGLSAEPDIVACVIYEPESGLFIYQFYSD